VEWGSKTLIEIGDEIESVMRRKHRNSLRPRWKSSETTYGATDRDGTITQGGYSRQVVVTAALVPPDRLSPGFGHYTSEIVKPLPDEVRVGSIAGDFQQPGQGVQIHFPGGMKKWIEDGYIKVV
jgi:hypothetical protein